MNLWNLQISIFISIMYFYSIRRNSNVKFDSYPSSSTQPTRRHVANLHFHGSIRWCFYGMVKCQTHLNSFLGFTFQFLFSLCRVILIFLKPTELGVSSVSWLLLLLLYLVICMLVSTGRGRSWEVPSCTTPTMIIYKYC